MVVSGAGARKKRQEEKERENRSDEVEKKEEEKKTVGRRKEGRDRNIKKGKKEKGWEDKVRTALEGRGIGVGLANTRGGDLFPMIFLAVLIRKRLLRDFTSLLIR